jgi:hypothetical protein
MTHGDLLGQFTHADTGRLERRVSAPRWPVPTRIVLDGDCLRYRWTPGKERPGITADGLIGPAPGLLEDFLRLGDASASQVLRYARRWGVLGLCEHDFPAQHPPQYWPSRAIEAHACPYVWNDPYGLGPPRPSARPPRRARPSRRANKIWVNPRADFHTCHVRGVFEADEYIAKPWEPVDAWRTWARRAHALLAVAAALQQNELGAEPDWRIATDTKIETPKTHAEGWRLVAYFADYWLKAADVRPWVQFQDEVVRLTLGSDWGHSPLFGAIAVQIVLAIGGADGFVVCDACRNVYAPRRTPRGGERHYCQTCRDRKIPQRDAASRYRKGETKKRRWSRHHQHRPRGK